MQYFDNDPGAFNQVAASSKSTIKLPTGMLYHEIRVALTNITAAQIGEVRLRANNRTIMSLTGPQLDTLNQFDRRQSIATDDIMVIPFNRYNLMQRDAEEVTALLTGTNNPYEDGAAIVQLRLDITLLAGPVNPAMSVIAVQSEKNPNIGYVMRTIEAITRDTAAGKNILSNIPDSIPLVSETQALINRILFNDSGDITGLKINRGKIPIFDRLVADNQAVQKDGVRTPQANWTAYDPSERGYGGNPLQVAGFQQFDFELQQTAGVAAMPIIVEYLGTLGN